MKIAFTSCCDPHNDEKQVAWPELAKQKPDVLVLLGDNMYMDYGFKPNPLKNGTPKELPLSKFSEHMHDNYAKQWAVPNFQKAINTIPKIYAIWDDHDFAWNNGRGIGSGATDTFDEFVPDTYRKLSRALFQQFRDELARTNKATTYPGNPYPNGVVDFDLGSIEDTIHLSDNIHLHLLDGRSFRPERDKTKSFLGEAQQKALQNQLLKNSGIHLIASGTVLDDWKKYSDKKWLNSIAENANIIVLSGDIHKPSFYHRHRIFEFTASAMAQPAKITTIFGKESNVFGILEIFDKTIVTNIYQWDTKKLELVARKSAEIDKTNWVLTGLSEKSNDYQDY